jgi:hypothetical protein
VGQRVDYIARLAGKEDPRKWYAQFSELAMARDTEAEKEGSHRDDDRPGQLEVDASAPTSQVV